MLMGKMQSLLVRDSAAQGGNSVAIGRMNLKRAANGGTAVGQGAASWCFVKMMRSAIWC